MIADGGSGGNIGGGGGNIVFVFGSKLSDNEVPIESGSFLKEGYTPTSP